jgi:hypothetical protein
MVNVTRNCMAFTAVAGAALVVLENLIPSKDFAKPLRLSVCAGSGSWYRYLESFIPNALAVRNVYITCHGLGMFRMNFQR